MKEEDRKYEEWLDEVKCKQPVLTNPDALTADILQRVYALQKAKKTGRRKKGLYRFGSWLSGIAAAVLFCFLLAETMDMSACPDSGTPGFIRETGTTSTFPQNWKQMNLTDKRSYLFTLQKQQERKRELIYTNLENKLLNEPPHENK